MGLPSMPRHSYEWSSLFFSFSFSFFLVIVACVHPTLLLMYDVACDCLFELFHRIVACAHCTLSLRV